MGSGSPTAQSCRAPGIDSGDYSAFAVGFLVVLFVMLTSYRYPIMWKASSLSFCTPPLFPNLVMLALVGLWILRAQIRESGPAAA